MGVEPTAACLCSQPPILKIGTPTGTQTPPREVYSRQCSIHSQSSGQATDCELITVILKQRELWIALL